MKTGTKLIALMALLAAGSAGAATTQTQANTLITNQAEATFTVPDPAAPNDPTKGESVTVKSNVVTTYVKPVPLFDVTYDSGKTDGTTLTGTGDAAPLSSGVKKPGEVVTTTYKLVNNGNTPLTVNLRADTTGSDTAPTDVAYTFATCDGTAITATPVGGVYSVTVPSVNNGATTCDDTIITVTQTFTVPDVTRDKIVGASPEAWVVGTGATVSATGVTGNGYDPNSLNYEDGKTENADLQFVKVQFFVPSVNVDPSTTTDPTTPKNPDGSTATPPTVVTTTTPPVVLGVTTPTNPPTYTSGTTLVLIDGDIQRAYPKVDPDPNPDFVTFTNTITSTQNDTLQLFPTNADGTFNTNWSYDAATGTFTKDSQTIQFLDPVTGAVIKKGPGATYPTITVAKDSTVYFQTKVTYAENDTNLWTDPITIVVGADSLGDSGIVAENPDPRDGGLTTDIIYPAAAQFSDHDTTNHQATNEAVNELVDTSATTTGAYNSTAINDRTASFPMDLVNNGQYTDTFTLEGSVVGQTWTVKYYDASGNQITTPVSVTAGQEIRVYAVVDVLEGTAAGLYTVNQKATGTYSTIFRDDTNDTITVKTSGALVIGKFTATSDTVAANNHYITGNPGTVNVTPAGGQVPSNGVGNPANYTAYATTHAPAVAYTYQIIAKNTYNSTVSNVTLTDDLNANLNFVGATCYVYKDVKGTLSDYTDDEIVTSKTCSVPNVGNRLTTTAVSLASGEYVVLTVTVNVK